MLANQRRVPNTFPGSDRSVETRPRDAATAFYGHWLAKPQAGEEHPWSNAPLTAIPHNADSLTITRVHHDVVAVVRLLVRTATYTGRFVHVVRAGIDVVPPCSAGL